MLDNTALTWILLFFIVIFAFSGFFLVVLDYFTWEEWRKASALTEDLEKSIDDYEAMRRKYLSEVESVWDDRQREINEARLRAESRLPTSQIPDWLFGHPTVSHEDVDKLRMDEVARKRAEREQEQGPEI